MEISPNGTQKDVATGLNFPTGVAVDALGDVYISEYFGPGNTGAGSVVMVPAGGGALQQILSGTFVDPNGLALNLSGHLFVADSGSGQVDMVAGQTLVGSPAVGLRTPAGMAVAAPPPPFTADTPPTTASVNETYTYDYQTGYNSGATSTFAVVAGTLLPASRWTPPAARCRGNRRSPGRTPSPVYRLDDTARATYAPSVTIAVDPVPGFVVTNLAFTGSAAAPTLTLTGAGFGTKATLGTPQQPWLAHRHDGEELRRELLAGRHHRGLERRRQRRRPSATNSACTWCPTRRARSSSHSARRIQPTGRRTPGDSVTIHLFGATFTTTVTYT